MGPQSQYHRDPASHAGLKDTATATNTPGHPRYLQESYQNDTQAPKITRLIVALLCQ